MNENKNFEAKRAATFAQKVVDSMVSIEGAPEEHDVYSLGTLKTLRSSGALCALAGAVTFRS